VAAETVRRDRGPRNDLGAGEEQHAQRRVAAELGCDVQQRRFRAA
jgi:hypothetical protein